MDEELEQILDRAEEFLSAANLLHESGLYNAAFDDARHAAELAAKALLLYHSGSYPTKHQVASELHKAGLIPHHIPPKMVSRLLAGFTTGRYGFRQEKGHEEVAEALTVATALLDAIRG